jgi:8-oxo-dGTP diphosphatase
VTVRAVFWEDAHARAVAEQLRANGFDAALARERFAGEDDDEDHPWVVLTDAPAVMVELLLDAYDGWLDEADDEPPSGTPAPLDLPEAPRRLKGRGPAE